MSKIIMNCPKCGRPLLPNEICSCDSFSVYQREAELEREKQTKREMQQEIQTKKTEKRVEIAGKAADVADSALRNTASFFSKCHQAFTEKVSSEEFTEGLSVCEVAIMFGLNFIMSAIMTYLVLTQSIFSSLLTSFALLIGVNHFAVFLLSLLLTAFATVLKIGLWAIVIKKAPADTIRQSCGLYLYSIPVVLLVILFSWLSMLCIPLFLFLIAIWVLFTETSIEKTEKNPRKLVLVIGVQFILVSVIGQILFSSLM